MFDSITCVDEFPYASGLGSYRLETLDPTLMLQLVLTQRPNAARRFVDAIKKYKGTQAHPSRTIVAFDEFQAGSLNRPDL